MGRRHIKALKKIYSKINPTNFWTVLLLVASATYLRVDGLGEYYFESDDAMHIWFAEKIFLDGVLNHLRVDTHPPLYYILLNRLMELMGDLISPLGIRLVSLAAGIGLVPIGYFLGRAFFKSSIAGVTLSFLFAMSPLFIEESQSIRQYTLAFFFLAVAFLFIYPKFSFSRFNFYALFCLLGCLTHYGSIITITGFSVIVLYQLWQTRIGTRYSYLYWFLLHVGLAALVVYMSTERTSRAAVYMLLPQTKAGMPSSLEVVTYQFWHLFVAGVDIVYLRYISPLLIVIGLYILYIQRQFTVFLVCLIPYVTFVFLEIIGKYPFSSGRWSIFVTLTFFLPVVNMLTKTNITARLPDSFFKILIAGCTLVMATCIDADTYRWSPHWAGKHGDLAKIQADIKPLYDRGRPLVVPEAFLFSIRMEHYLPKNWILNLKQFNRVSSCTWHLYLSELRDGALCHCHYIPKPPNADRLVVLAKVESPEEEKDEDEVFHNECGTGKLISRHGSNALFEFQWASKF